MEWERDIVKLLATQEIKKSRGEGRLHHGGPVSESGVELEAKKDSEGEESPGSAEVEETP